MQIAQNVNHLRSWCSCFWMTIENGSICCRQWVLLYLLWVLLRLQSLLLFECHDVFLLLLSIKSIISIPVPQSILLESDCSDSSQRLSVVAITVIVTLSISMILWNVQMLWLEGDRHGNAAKHGIERLLQWRDRERWSWWRIMDECTHTITRRHTYNCLIHAHQKLWWNSNCLCSSSFLKEGQALMAAWGGGITWLLMITMLSNLLAPLQRWTINVPCVSTKSKWRRSGLLRTTSQLSLVAFHH